MMVATKATYDGECRYCCRAKSRIIVAPPSARLIKSKSIGPSRTERDANTQIAHCFLV